jgi:PEP-CTERM motif
MSRYLKTAAAALVLMAVSSPAQAQFTLSGLSCNNGGAMAFMGAINCAGAFNGNLGGNPTNRANVLSQLNTSFGGSHTLVGFSNATPFAFSNNPNTQTQGTLNFTNTVYGTFVLGLKSSTHFSFYQFDAGQAGMNSVSFTTIGTSVNGNGAAQNLSHAALYQDPSLSIRTVVPEPSTYAMMFGGMLALGVAARRRRKQ